MTVATRISDAPKPNLHPLSPPTKPPDAATSKNRCKSERFRIEQRVCREAMLLERTSTRPTVTQQYCTCAKPKLVQQKHTLLTRLLSLRHAQSANEPGSVGARSGFVHLIPSQKQAHAACCCVSCDALPKNAHPVPHGMGSLAAHSPGALARVKCT